jgi:hypothetical protein
MAESDTILQLGIDAAREGNREEARNLFGLLTRQEPDNLQAWLWLAGVADGPDERRAALERVLELDPTNEMASKGLQAMGVAPAARAEESEGPPPAAVAATAAAAAAAPAREMTDEERYAAELDSAFEDYDTVPKAEAPPRPASDLETESSAARAETERRAASRASARERSAARRATTPIHSGDEDEDLRPATGAPSMLRWILIGAAILLSVLFLAFIFFNRPGGGSTANTPTGVAGSPAAGTPSAGLPSGGDGITPTEVLTPTELPTTEPLTPSAELTPTTSLPPTPGPASPSELSKASPQPVAVGAPVSANGWTFTFPGICQVNCAVVYGPQLGNLTAKGTYALVLVVVMNNTGKDQPIPPDFFVLKDDQGRVYMAQPQASTVYLQQGGVADISMESPVPANGLGTSMPLVFDVEHGATNLVLFTSAKPDQGWKVLDSVP